MFQAAFTAAPFVDEWFLGCYFGNAEDGYHDAVCVKFTDLEAYRTHMRLPHGPDEAAHLREQIARIKAFDIITPDEPVDTGEKIVELYKERWKLFPDVAKALREDVNASLPYL